MTRLLASLLALLLAVYPASAQIPGQIPPGTVLGNSGAVPAQPQPVTLPALSPGIDSNAVNAFTANHTIASADCGATVQAGTGATGSFILTLPAVAGFPTSCSVLVKNGDTGRAKSLAGFPSDLSTYLWPQQSVGVKIVNGAWASFYNPGRWQVTVNTTAFVDSVLGSDANDCLAAGAGNACQTMTAMFNRILNQWDTAGHTTTFQAAAGQSWSNVNLAAPLNFRGNIILDGGTGTFTASSANALTVNADRALGNVTIQNVTITCSGGANGISGTSGFTVIGAGVTFGACPGGIQRVVANGAEMTATNSYAISGGAAAHIYADAVSLQDDFIAITVTLTGTPAFSQGFAVAVLNGTTFSAGTTFSGAATGPRFSAASGGFIGSNGAGANYFPGNAVGVCATGGMYDNICPGDLSVAWTAFTPSLTCGTATFTTTSARSRTVGKTTWAEIDFTITAIGTCTNNLTLTLPNTANSAGVLAGQEIVNSATTVTCAALAASATAACRRQALSAYSVNDRVVASGVYENQ